MYTYILFIIRRLKADFLKLTPIKNILRAVYYFGSQRVNLSEQFQQLQRMKMKTMVITRKMAKQGMKIKQNVMMVEVEVLVLLWGPHLLLFLSSLL